MLIRNLKLVVSCFLIFIIICSLIFGIYSRGKYKSYLGSGRVPDIQAWSIKASVSCAIAIIMSIIMGVLFIIED